MQKKKTVNCKFQILNCNLSYFQGNKYSLDTCLAYPEILATPGCAANLTPQMCAVTPAITMIPLCLDALQGYQPSLFECVDNKAQLCSLNLCEKHEFVVKCNS